MSSSPFPSESSLEPVSVLVADDLPEMRELLRIWLTDAGCQVTLVSGGREAVQELHRQTFDVVVTDILMPDGDGLEVITEIKRGRRYMAILAISGGGDLLGADDCLKIAHGLGAHRVLLKPFNRATFLSTFDELRREHVESARAAKRPVAGPPA